MVPSNCTPIPNAITGHRNLRIPLFRRRLAPPQRDRKNVLATAIPILKRLRGSQRCPAFPSAQRMPRIRTPSNSHIRYTSSVTTSAAPLATCANELQAILQLPHRMRRLLACRSRLTRRLTPSEIRRKCKICKIRVQLTYPGSEAVGFVSEIRVHAVCSLQPVFAPFLQLQKPVKPVRSVRFAAARHWRDCGSNRRCSEPSGTIAAEKRRRMVGHRRG